MSLTNEPSHPAGETQPEESVKLTLAPFMPEGKLQLPFKFAYGNKIFDNTTKLFTVLLPSGEAVEVDLPITQQPMFSLREKLSNHPAIAPFSSYRLEGAQQDEQGQFVTNFEVLNEWVPYGREKTFNTLRIAPLPYSGIGLDVHLLNFRDFLLFPYHMDISSLFDTHPVNVPPVVENNRSSLAFQSLLSDMTEKRFALFADFVENQLRPLLDAEANPKNPAVSSSVKVDNQIVEQMASLIDETATLNPEMDFLAELKDAVLAHLLQPSVDTKQQIVFEDISFQDPVTRLSFQNPATFKLLKSIEVVSADVTSNPSQPTMTLKVITFDREDQRSSGSTATKKNNKKGSKKNKQQQGKSQNKNSQVASEFVIHCSSEGFSFEGKQQEQEEKQTPFLTLQEALLSCSRSFQCRTRAFAAFIEGGQMHVRCSPLLSTLLKARGVFSSGSSDPVLGHKYQLLQVSVHDPASWIESPPCTHNEVSGLELYLRERFEHHFKLSNLPLDLLESYLTGGHKKGHETDEEKKEALLEQPQATEQELQEAQELREAQEAQEPDFVNMTRVMRYSFRLAGGDQEALQQLVIGSPHPMLSPLSSLPPDAFASESQLGRMPNTLNPKHPIETQSQWNEFFQYSMDMLRVVSQEYFTMENFQDAKVQMQTSERTYMYTRDHYNELLTVIKDPSNTSEDLKMMILTTAMEMEQALSSHFHAQSIINKIKALALDQLASDNVPFSELIETYGNEEEKGQVLTRDRIYELLVLKHAAEKEGKQEEEQQEETGNSVFDRFDTLDGYLNGIYEDYEQAYNDVEHLVISLFDNFDEYCTDIVPKLIQGEIASLSDFLDDSEGKDEGDEQTILEANIAAILAQEEARRGEPMSEEEKVQLRAYLLAMQEKSGASSSETQSDSWFVDHIFFAIVGDSNLTAPGEEHKDLNGGLGREFYYKHMKNELRHLSMLQLHQLMAAIRENKIDMMLRNLSFPLSTIVDFRGVRVLCQAIIPGVLNVDPTLSGSERMERLLFGFLDQNTPLRMKKDIHELEVALRYFFHLPLRSSYKLPVYTVPEDKKDDLAIYHLYNEEDEVPRLHSLTDSEATETTESGAVVEYISTPLPPSMKILRGTDGRAYVLECGQISPRDFNFMLTSRKIAENENLDFIASSPFSSLGSTTKKVEYFTKAIEEQVNNPLLQASMLQEGVSRSQLFEHASSLYKKYAASSPYLKETLGVKTTDQERDYVLKLSNENNSQSTSSEQEEETKQASSSSVSSSVSSSIPTVYPEFFEGASHLDTSHYDPFHHCLLRRECVLLYIESLVERERERYRQAREQVLAHLQAKWEEEHGMAFATYIRILEYLQLRQSTAHSVAVQRMEMNEKKKKEEEEEGEKEEKDEKEQEEALSESLRQKMDISPYIVNKDSLPTLSEHELNTIGEGITQDDVSRVFDASHEKFIPHPPYPLEFWVPFAANQYERMLTENTTMTTFRHQLVDGEDLIFVERVRAAITFDLHDQSIRNTGSSKEGKEEQEDSHLYGAVKMTEEEKQAVKQEQYSNITPAHMDQLVRELRLKKKREEQENKKEEEEDEEGEETKKEEGEETKKEEDNKPFTAEEYASLEKEVRVMLSERITSFEDMHDTFAFDLLGIADLASQKLSASRQSQNPIETTFSYLSIPHCQTSNPALRSWVQENPMSYPLRHLHEANHAHEASKFLITDLLVMLTQEIALSLTSVPSSPAELSELLHSRGINMRYIGLLSEYAKEYQTEHFKKAGQSRFLKTSDEAIDPNIWRHDLSAWISLLEMEMIARGAKHTLRALFSTETVLVKDESGKRQVLGWGEREAAWLLNVLFMGPSSVEQLESIMQGNKNDNIPSLDGLPSPMVVLQTLRTQIQQRYLTTPSMIFEDYIMKPTNETSSEQLYLNDKYIINSSMAYNPYALLQWICYHCHFSIAPSPSRASLRDSNFGGESEFTSYFEFINPTSVNNTTQIQGSQKKKNKKGKQQKGRKQKQQQQQQQTVSNDINPSQQLTEAYKEYGTNTSSSSSSSSSSSGILRNHAPILPSSSFGLSHYVCSGFSVDDVVAIYPTNKRVISGFRITAATASNNSLGALVRDNHNKPAFHHTHARGSASFNIKFDRKTGRPLNETDRSYSPYSFIRHLPSEPALYKRSLAHAQIFSEQGLTHSYSAISQLDHFNTYLYVPTGSSSSVNHHQYYFWRIGRRFFRLIDEIKGGRIFSALSKVQRIIDSVKGTLGSLHPFVFYLLFQYAVLLRDIDYAQDPVVLFRNLRDMTSLVLPSYSIEATKYGLSLTNLMMEINSSLPQYGSVLQLFKNLQLASPKPCPTMLVHYTKVMGDSITSSSASDGFNFLFRMYTQCIQHSNVTGEDIPHLMHALEVLRRAEAQTASQEQEGDAIQRTSTTPYVDYMLAEEVTLDGFQIDRDEEHPGKGTIDLPLVQAFNLPFLNHMTLLLSLSRAYAHELEGRTPGPGFFKETIFQLVQGVESEIRKYSSLKTSEKWFSPPTQDDRRKNELELEESFMRTFAEFTEYSAYSYAAKMDS